MGISAFLVCCQLSLIGIAACLVGIVRLGPRFAIGAVSSIAGALMVWGGYVALIGILERTWTLRSAGFWLASLVGCAGLWLLVMGVRRAAARRFGPGRCARCGYELAGLSPCPECGST